MNVVEVNPEVVTALRASIERQNEVIAYLITKVGQMQKLIERQNENIAELVKWAQST